MVGDGIGTCSIVFDERTFLRCCVHVEIYSPATPFYLAISCAVDGSEECGILIVVEVVGQQILCFHIEVECQIREFIMVNGSVHDAYVPIAVVDGVALEKDFVGYHAHLAVTERIAGV